MDILLVPAIESDGRELLIRLEAYYRELSHFNPWLYDLTQGFSYPNLSLYFNDPKRHAYFIKSARHDVGIAFVHNFSHRTGSSEINDIEEFYVYPDYRGVGAGRRAAHLLFNKFPGEWEVRVREANTPGMAFWGAILPKLGSTHRTLTWSEDRSRWQVHKFTVNA